MKGLVKAACLAVLLCLLPISTLAEHTVEYYYRNYCESCDPEEEFAAAFESLTGIRLSDCDFHGYNTVTTLGQDAMNQRAQALGVENPMSPMIVIDEKVYQGDSALRSQLPKEALAWAGTTDSVVVYVYTPACESCGRASAALAELPETMTVRRGEYVFESAVVIKKIDASAHSDQTDRLFAAYAVPDVDRITPIVFLGSHYLSGADRIERDLPDMIRLGWAVGGLAHATGETEPAAHEVLSLTASIGAGLVAGFNPCAISMLLLFLSLVLESGKRTRPLVFIFLIAKICCYLLIGIFLLEVLQTFNPTWLLPLARWIMSILGGGLILLNLWDAWQIRTGRWDKIRNQLPDPLKKGLHRIIRQFLSNQRVWFLAAFALGILVAAGEFLCAGQLYLIRLLAAVRETAAQQGANLVAYCLAFITPSLVLSGLLLGGMSSLRISDFFARHMMAAKLAAAIATLAMILLSWLI